MQHRPVNLAACLHLLQVPMQFRLGLRHSLQQLVDHLCVVLLESVIDLGQLLLGLLIDSRL